MLKVDDVIREQLLIDTHLMLTDMRPLDQHGVSLIAPRNSPQSLTISNNFSALKTEFVRLQSN